MKSSGENRKRFTASGVDSGVDAWMQQIYEANIAYRDDEVTAHVTDNIPNLNVILAEIGFQIVGNGPHKKLVGGSKSQLAYLSFARKNVDPTINSDPQMAQALMQGIQIIASNPEFTAKVGVPRILKMLEMVVKFGGGPSDYDITSAVPEDQVASPQLMQQLAPILQQLQQTIMQGVGENIAKPAAEAAAKAEAEIQQLQSAVKQMEGIFALAKNASDKANVKAQEVSQKIQLDAATAQADQMRLGAQLQAEQVRLTAQAAAEQQRLSAAAAAEQQRLDAQAAADQARLQSEHEAALQRAAEKAQLDAAIVAGKAASDVEKTRIMAEANAEAARVKAVAAASVKKSSKSSKE